MKTAEKILVTGATGLVGAAMVSALVAKGNVVKTYSKHKPNLKNFPENVEVILGDILDVSVLNDAMLGVDVVYHCLDFMSFLDSDAEKIFDINVKGTENVVNAALANEVRKVVYISSTQAFGTHQHKEKISEKTSWIEHKDNTLYAICKNRAELEIWRGKEEGLEMLIVNPSIILAPQENKMYNFAQIAKANYKFYPKGKNGFITLHDVVKATIYLNENNVSGERFILNAENLTYWEVLTALNPLIKKPLLGERMNLVKANIIWQYNRFRNIVFGAKPFLSKEIYTFNAKEFEFSNSKIFDTIDFKFTPIAEYIAEIK